MARIRYVLHENSLVQTSLREPRSPSNNFNFSDSELSWLPDSVKEFILPAGFPGKHVIQFLFQYMMKLFWLLLFCLINTLRPPPPHTLLTNKSVMEVINLFISLVEYKRAIIGMVAKLYVYSFFEYNV